MHEQDLVPVIEALVAMPGQFARILQSVPADYLNWEPKSWDGVPGEKFSALAQACHLRDIETDGYHLRVRRMLDEDAPDLASIDSYALARERAYATSDPIQAVAAFRAARCQTIDVLSNLTTRELARRGTFAEYGQITLRGLIHYLCSHDQQHLACMQWLLGRIASQRK